MTTNTNQTSENSEPPKLSTNNLKIGDWLDKLNEFHLNYPRYTLFLYFIILTSAFIGFMVFATRANVASNIVTIVGIIYGFISTMISAVVSRVDIRKEANKTITETWLPMAEGASRRLYTISDSLERLRLKQDYVCTNLQPILSKLDDADAQIVTQLVSIQCENSADQMRAIRSQVNDAISDWRNFISNNCEDGECDVVFSSLNNTWREHSIMLLTDFPNYTGLVSYIALKELGGILNEESGSEANKMTDEELQLAREEISVIKDVEHLASTNPN